MVPATTRRFRDGVAQESAFDGMTVERAITE